MRAIPLRFELNSVSADMINNYVIFKTYLVLAVSKQCVKLCIRVEYSNGHYVPTKSVGFLLFWSSTDFNCLL